MNIKYLAIFILSVSINGCFSHGESVEVQISNSGYIINNLKSPIATSVVEEITRLKPEKVLILRCPNTPNERIIQFERELRSKHTSILEMSNTDNNCEF